MEISSCQDANLEETPSCGFQPVLIFITTGMIVAMGATCIGASVSSCDSAMADRHDASTAAIDGAFDVGNENSYHLASQLVNSTMSAVLEKMESGFSSAGLTFLQLNDIFRILTPKSDGTYNIEEVNNLLISHLAAIPRLHEITALTEAALIQSGPYPFSVYVTFLDLVRGGFTALIGNSTILLYGEAKLSGEFIRGPCEMRDGPIPYANNTGFVQKPYGECEYTQISKEDMMKGAGNLAAIPVGLEFWGSLRSIAGIVSLPMRFALAEGLVIDLGMRTSTLTKFFEKDVQSMLPEGGKSYCIQSDLFNNIGITVAVSNGSFLAEVNGLKTTANITSEDISDDDIRESARWIFTQGWANVSDTNMREVEINGNLQWVKVSSYRRATLHLFLVIVVPRESVLGSLERAVIKTKTIIADKEHVTNQDLKKSRTNVVVATILFGLLLIAASVIISRLIVGPLRSLETKMAEVAKMNLEASVHEKFSILTEVKRMEMSFLTMVTRLREYRSYMPEGCLVDQDELIDDEAAGVEAPQGKVAVVFTDIQGSTALWESCPTTMGKALKIHNEIMRKNICENDGYEVKTIGDAFMVVFESPVKAVNFCLGTQKDLVAAEWPSEVLQVPSCKPTKNGDNHLWNGFRVRMGINYGDTESELNPVASRHDYFGSTVNTAARTEAAGIGGTVGITQSTKDSIDMASCGDPFLIPQGAFDLKGVKGMTELFMLVPASLAGRSTLSFRGVKEVVKHSSILSIGAARLKAGHSVSMTQHHMRSTIATVATVRINISGMSSRDVTYYSHSTVQAVDEAIERTGGLMMYVCGSTTVLSWNSGKPCSQHATSASRFVSLFNREADVKCLQGNLLSIGICTGGILEGHVGTDRRKFTTIIGWPVMLSDYAADAGLIATQALALVVEADFPGLACDPGHRTQVRRIAQWTTSGKPPVVNVYELRSNSNEDKWGFSELEELDNSNTDTNSWDVGKNAMNELIENRNPQLLQRLLSEYPNQTVYQYALQCFSNTKSVPSKPAVGAVCVLSFSLKGKLYKKKKKTDERSTH